MSKTKYTYDQIQKALEQMIEECLYEVAILDKTQILCHKHTFDIVWENAHIGSRSTKLLLHKEDKKCELCFTTL
jgi:hypothetical protein